jgi:hypothetical protein
MWLLLLEIGDFILRLTCLGYTWEKTAWTLDDPRRARDDHVYHRGERNIRLRHKGQEVTWPMLEFSLVLDMVSGHVT